MLLNHSPAFHSVVVHTSGWSLKEIKISFSIYTTLEKEVNSKPVRKCLCPTFTYTQMDGQVESIMPPVAHRMGDEAAKA